MSSPHISFRRVTSALATRRPSMICCCRTPSTRNRIRSTFSPGLDVDVGGSRLDGIVEHGLQKFQHRRIGRALFRRELFEIDLALLQIVAHGLGQRGYLIGVPVNGVERLEKIRFATKARRIGCLSLDRSSS